MEDTLPTWTYRQEKDCDRNRSVDDSKIVQVFPGPSTFHGQSRRDQVLVQRPLDDRFQETNRQPQDKPPSMATSLQLLDPG